MHSAHLLIAISIAVIIGLVLFWVNLESLQNDIGEPNLLYLFLIGAVAGIIVYLFLTSKGYHML